jgi:hypothetical protein
MTVMDDPLEPLLAGHSPEVRDVTSRLRALILEVMPGVTEQIDLPDHIVAYGFGGPKGIRMRDLAVGLGPHTAHVNVQFVDGARLPDPAGIIEGTGKRIRHVKCRSGDDVARPALRRLIEEQFALKRESSTG